VAHDAAEFDYAPPLDKYAAARLLGIEPRLIHSRAWRARYGVPALRVGGALRFDPQELQRWLARRREQFPGDAA
jgi:hypothetical protein